MDDEAIFPRASSSKINSINSLNRCFQTTKLIAIEISGDCLITVKQFVMDNSLNVSHLTLNMILFGEETHFLVTEQVCFLNFLN